jgi:hypothetical protein
MGNEGAHSLSPIRVVNGAFVLCGQEKKGTSIGTSIIPDEYPLKTNLYSHSLAAVLLLLADRLYDHRVGSELQAVAFVCSGTKVTKDGEKRFLAALPVPEKIEVSSWPVHPAGPKGKEHGSLEQETTRVGRAA